MPNYSNNKNYRIYCKDPNITDCYIGCSTDPSRCRLHKVVCNTKTNKGYNYKIYQFIRANGGWDNWIFEYIEDYPCENEEQQHIRERYWYDYYKATLNTKVPRRTFIEYLEWRKKREYPLII